MTDGQLVYRNTGNTALLDMVHTKSGNALDCGCGAGDNARLLAGDGWRVLGVTIDPQEAPSAREFCYDVVIADFEDGLPTEAAGSFELVLMSHVLEHLANPAKLLSDVRRALSPNGTVAVALPNVLHYRQRFAFMRGNFTYEETGTLDRTHLRFYTFSSARKLLESNGFEVVEAKADGSLPWSHLRKLIPARLAIRLDHFACKRWPDLFGYQSLFTLRVSSSAGDVIRSTAGG